MPAVNQQGIKTMEGAPKTFEQFAAESEELKLIIEEIDSIARELRTTAMRLNSYSSAQPEISSILQRQEDAYKRYFEVKARLFEEFNKK